MSNILLAKQSIQTKHLVNIHWLMVGTHASHILLSVYAY
jgi:hypothetical protein